MSQCDYDGRTALHLAVCENHYEIVEFLLKDCKSKFKYDDRWGNTFFMEADKIKI